MIRLKNILLLSLISLFTTYTVFAVPPIPEMTPKKASSKRGHRGKRGYPGPQGPQGPQGCTGATGHDGRNGNDGSGGSSGRNGVDGKDGETGATGPQGPIGRGFELSAPLYFDDFISGGTGPGTIGALGWHWTGTVPSHMPATPGHPGIIKVPPGTRMSLNQSTECNALLEEKEFDLKICCQFQGSLSCDGQVNIGFSKVTFELYCGAKNIDVRVLSESDQIEQLQVKENVWYVFQIHKEDSKVTFTISSTTFSDPYVKIFELANSDSINPGDIRIDNKSAGTPLNVCVDYVVLDVPHIGR